LKIIIFAHAPFGRSSAGRFPHYYPNQAGALSPKQVIRDFPATAPRAISLAAKADSSIIICVTSQIDVAHVAELADALDSGSSE
jgi:hypothetical protein